MWLGRAFLYTDGGGGLRPHPPLREVWYVDTKLLDSGYHLEVDFLLAISRGGKTKYIYELTITLSVPQVQLGDVIISLFSFTTACVSALEVRQSFGGVWRWQQMVASTKHKDWRKDSRSFPSEFLRFTRRKIDLLRTACFLIISVPHPPTRHDHRTHKLYAI